METETPVFQRSKGGCKTGRKGRKENRCRFGNCDPASGAVCDPSSCGGASPAPAVAAPVSYTHLDVYKRQLQAYEAKLEQMAERGSVGRASISDQLKAGKAAAEQAKAERPPKEKPSRSAER